MSSGQMDRYHGHKWTIFLGHISNTSKKPIKYFKGTYEISKGKLRNIWRKTMK